MTDGLSSYDASLLAAADRYWSNSGPDACGVLTVERPVPFVGDSDEGGWCLVRCEVLVEDGAVSGAYLEGTADAVVLTRAELSEAEERAAFDWQ